MTFAPEILTRDVSLFCGDCIAVLRTLKDNSVDSVVTDPPYHLTSIVKRFGSPTAAPAKIGKTGAYARASAGFMGKQWDGGDIAFRAELWAEVLRVLKPGGFLLSCGGTRTYHRMACAIEDAGFEVRDMISWLYGSGFPKSLDVSKAIDKAQGASRAITRMGQTKSHELSGKFDLADSSQRERRDDPVTALALEWSGFGTALKPACEPIVLARKPLSESTVAANVLKWGTGALNIDGCRVDAGQNGKPLRGNHAARPTDGAASSFDMGSRYALGSTSEGRWPANVIHDGSDEVVDHFPYRKCGDGAVLRESGADRSGNVSSAFGAESRPAGTVTPTYGDEGSAARFFYTAKADANDRLGSKHPTVKPLDLMQYLVRLVTPPKGLVLDPFAGTGTTGEAALRGGMRAILIEREEEYQNDIRRRMKLAMSGPDERARESIKAKFKDKPIDAGPLFDTYDAQDDLAKSLDEGYRAIRNRVAAGGPAWEPK